MSKFEKEASQIVDTLGLKWAPMAARFSVENEEIGDSSKKLGVCDAFDVVRRDDVVVCLSKENCVCPGGRHFTGLESIPLESLAAAVSGKGHKVYASKKAALISVRKQPQPVKRGNFLCLGPLRKFKASPHIVFLFVNPAQADRILGLVSFKGAEPFMYYPASSICSTITNVLAKGKPEINLISFFERKRGAWSTDELIVALPFKDFESTVKNIPKSGYGSA